MYKRKWMIAVLLTTMVVLSVCEVDYHGGEVCGKSADEACPSCTACSDMACVAPERPVHGRYEIATFVDPVTYASQHVIRYHCKRGYDLVGLAIRTCDGITKQWSTEEPYCEPKYVSELRTKWAALQAKVTAIDNRTTDMSDKIDTIVGGVANISDQLSGISDQVSDVVDLVTNLTNRISPIESRLANIEYGITAINTRVTNIEYGINGINVRVTSIESYITGTNKRVATVESGLNVINKKVTNIESIVSSLGEGCKSDHGEGEHKDHYGHDHP